MAAGASGGRRGDLAARAERDPAGDRPGHRPVAGWRAERARGGAWCAAKVVEIDPYTTTEKVRVRRMLDIPAIFSRGEAQAHVNALVRRGELR